jgi:hypothetical protein
VLAETQRHGVKLAILTVLVAASFGGRAGAEPPASQFGFSVAGLYPTFRPLIHDYVVRCHDGPVTVNGHADGAWEAAVGNHPFRQGSFSEGVSLATGLQFTVIVLRVGGSQAYRYHVRCLPDDFPDYTFTRSGPVSPRFFSVDEAFFPAPTQRYAMIFNGHGVPLWWSRAAAWATRVRPNGNVLWCDFADDQTFGVHRLDGTLVRNLTPPDQGIDPHDLQFVGDGSYLVGKKVVQAHVDTSAYGGSSDAAVTNEELQQVSANGQVTWDWRSQDHISLAETGHRWPWVINNAGLGGYDIVHWNSIEPDGNSVIASFRNLDAVYKIRKDTGDIVWKLGGTTTPKSLTVKNDPRGAHLGAQHDARLLPDGTLTVFDNRTNLDNHEPRAVRFRIDEANRTATVLESITDPDVPKSNCCGSARRLDNGDWLIDWGKDRPIGGYEPDGDRTFLLTIDSTFSYRAEPVPSGAVSAQDLREAMDAMCAPGCS